MRGQLIYEKLNSIPLRKDCAQSFPHYLVTNSPFTCSNHAFVLLNMELAHPPRRGTNFKYQHWWVQYQETHSLHKTEKAQLDLKSWSRNTFNNFKNKLARNAETLLQVETKLVHDPNNARLNNWHYRLIKQRETMCRFNQKYWGKMARKDWLVNGDRNSRYFHQSMKARKTRNKITKIKDASGV
ncbi:hypothetical protein Cgig2_015663 [Carnegiea gigantea]|uniref:Uncharacterized protein n=1 Tax=Carnegiea gigantea TaxID=171969 RepID=A0A9Q1QB26_9CARY|nr:hypothetical protein Cgig2_015663 [Carnegiea gigantea]